LGLGGVALGGRVDAVTCLEVRAGEAGVAVDVGADQTWGLMVCSSSTDVVGR